jgi:pilus assembly protein CpaB
MRRRLVTVLLFAVLAALTASTAVYRVIAARTQPAKPAATTVVVAARDLGVGALVTADDLGTMAWPGAVAPGWMARPEDVVGRGIISSVNKGEPVAENRLAPRGAGAGLAASIPAGLRAVAVRGDEVVGVSGFVLPGMRVDVLSSGTPPGANAMVTRTVLQNIEVLSAGKNIDRDVQGRPESVQVVNLLVSPEQAETLSLAAAQTKIQLVLRNPLDVESSRTRGTSMGQLLLGIGPPAPRAAQTRPAAPPAPKPAPPAAAPPPAPPPVKAAPPSIEVINGQKRELVVIREPRKTEEKQ